MKTLNWLGLLVVAGVLLSVGMQLHARRGPAPVKPDTVLVTQILQAEAVRDTVRTTVTRWRDRADTVNVHDTVEVREFIRSLDTVFVNCMKCADRIDSLLRVVRALRDSVDQRRAAERSAKAQRPWYAIGGAILGGLSCRA